MTDALVEAVARGLAECDASGLRAKGIQSEQKPWRSFSAEATAALQAIEAAGYRVVPVEATEGMVNAGIDQTVIIRADDTEVRSVWSAMLSAAPRVGDL